MLRKLFAALLPRVFPLEEPERREPATGLGRLRELLRNPHYKLLALAIAVVAWSYVQGDEVHEARIKAQVLWTLPPALTTPDQLPTSVVLTVRGTRSATRRAENADVDLPVDLSDIGVGEHALAFDDFAPRNLPPGIEVLSVSPASVRFVLDEVAQRNVSIQPVLVGQPPDDFVVSSVFLEPQVVTVEGPRMLVERLRQIDTTPIDVSQVNGETVVEVDLDLPRSLRRIDATDRPRAVVAVQPRLEERELEVPVAVWGTYDWITRPERVRVALRGPSAEVHAIDPRDVLAVVHLPDAPDRPSYEAPFGPSEGARLDVIHPGSAEIEVTRVAPPRVEVVRR